MLEVVTFMQNVVFGSVNFFLGYFLIAEAFRWQEVLSKSLVTRLLAVCLGLSMIVGGVAVLDSISKLLVAGYLITVSSVYVYYDNIPPAGLVFYEPSPIRDLPPVA